jgi:hypothetical protein
LRSNAMAAPAPREPLGSFSNSSVVGRVLLTNSRYVIDEAKISANNRQSPLEHAAMARGVSQFRWSLGMMHPRDRSLFVTRLALDATRNATLQQTRLASAGRRSSVAS